MDTLGTAENVLISEESSFQGQFCTLLYVAGTMHSDLAETLDSVLIKGMSSFQGSPYRGVPLLNGRYNAACALTTYIYICKLL